MILETDEVVAVGAEVLLAKLDDRVGPPTCPRIGEAYGLHWAEAQTVAAPVRGLFNGKTAFEVLELFGGAGDRELFRFLRLDGFGGREGLYEAVVLFFGEGAVDA